jgi:hypothetical protein
VKADIKKKQSKKHLHYTYETFDIDTSFVCDILPLTAHKDAAIKRRKIMSYSYQVLHKPTLRSVSTIKIGGICLEDVTNSVRLPHDFELSCPVLQEIIRQFLKKIGLPRRKIANFMSDKFMDNMDVLYYMSVPLPDDIFCDDADINIMRHFMNGSYSPRYNDFLRWCFAIARLSDFNGFKEYDKINHTLN